MSRTISSTYTSGITLTSAANNPVSVTGRISVTSGVALTGKAGAYNWNVDNSGTIIATSLTEAVFLGSFGATVTSGTITNEAGGRISSGSYGVVISGPGSVTNKAGGTIAASALKAVYVRGGLGTVVNAGVLSAGNVAVYEYNGGSITNQAGGTITGAGGVWFEQAGTFTNFGVAIGTNAGFGSVLFNSTAGTNRLIDEPGASFSGGITSLQGGTNIVELGSAASAGTLAGFGTAITNFTSLQFDAGSQWTVIGNSATQGLGTIAIAGFTANDTIDLTGFVAVSETFAGNALVLTNAVTAHATLHVQGGFSSGDFHLSSDLSGGTFIVVCFAENTRIATPTGYVAIEDLTIDDLVQSHFAGAAAIQGINRRHVDCARHPDPRQVWPVRIDAGAFGPGRPARALRVSPNHAVYWDGDLIPIKLLINGGSIEQIQVDEITYYHLELARHDLLLAEGLLTESFLDVGDGSNFAGDGLTIRLHPDFSTITPNAAAIWETAGCAPLIVQGPRLAAARDHVNKVSRRAVPRRRTEPGTPVMLAGRW